MKALIAHIIACIFLLSAPTWAGDVSPFSEGVKAHGEKDYAKAAEMFWQAIEEEPNNSSAYYNFGLAQMGNRHYGTAMWAFEKVLKFDPNDAEAIEKLERCQQELDPAVEYKPVLGGFEASLFNVSSDTWALLAIVCSLAFCLSVVLFRLKRILSLRRILLITGFFSLALTVVCSIVSARTDAYYEGNHYGMVTQKSIPTFMDHENTAGIDLKEGTRLLLLDADTLEYMRVKDAIGNEHLVKSADLLFF